MAKKKKKAKIRLPVPSKPNQVFKDKKKYDRKTIKEKDPYKAADEVYDASDAFMAIFGFKRVNH